jgi:hypothetical protein
MLVTQLFCAGGNGLVAITERAQKNSEYGAGCSRKTA